MFLMLCALTIIIRKTPIWNFKVAVLVRVSLSLVVLSVKIYLSLLQSIRIASSLGHFEQKIILVASRVSAYVRVESESGRLTVVKKRARASATSPT